MKLVPVCQRIWRRSLPILATSLGLVLVSTASCNDQIMSAALLSLEDLALDLVAIFFTTLDFGTDALGGGDTTATTVQAITDTMGRLLA